jgi:hypothetical protein
MAGPSRHEEQQRQDLNMGYGGLTPKISFELKMDTLIQKLDDIGGSSSDPVQPLTKEERVMEKLGRKS